MLPENQLPPYSVSELLELAEEADTYLNDAKTDDEASARSDEVVNTLDSVAKQLYWGNKVDLYGIYEYALMDYTTEGEGAEYLMAEGKISGTSAGFTVIDTDTHFEHIVNLYDDEQQDFVDRLKDQIKGRYAVSHLVNLVNTAQSKNKNVKIITTNHMAQSPVAISSLEVPNTVMWLPEFARNSEVTTILNALRPESANLLEDIEVDMYNSDDALESLLRSSRKFRGLYSSNPQININAIADHFRRIMGDKLFGKIYNFPDGLPTSVSLASNHGLPTGSYTYFENAQYSAMVVDIASGPFFSGEVGAEKATDEKALYITVNVPSNYVGGFTTVAVPVESLHNHSFQLVS